MPVVVSLHHLRAYAGAANLYGQGENNNLQVENVKSDMRYVPVTQHLDFGLAGREILEYVRVIVQVNPYTAVRH